MHRKIAVAALVLAAISMVAAACTPGGPGGITWKVKPVSIEVVQGEDYDVGDEPYVIQLGFRSKLGVANSSVAYVSSQCRSGQLPATDVGYNGAVVPVPAGSADIVFSEAQNLDIGDVLFETAPFEIFGTMAFVMERDGIFPYACALTDVIETVLTGVMTDALNLLIAASPIPPTEQQLVDMIVARLGELLSIVPGLIAATFEGLGNPDDVLGTVIQIHLPTAGAFTELMNVGLNLAGLQNGVIEVDGLPPTTVFRIGHLLPSTASFRINGYGYTHIYNTSIGL